MENHVFSEVGFEFFKPAAHLVERIGIGDVVT
jgi:hypothetical protein